MCFFQVYQYVTPIVVLPLSYFAWLRWYDHDRESGSFLWASTAKCTDRRLGPYLAGLVGFPLPH